MNEEQLEEEKLDLDGEDEVTLGNHHVEEPEYSHQDGDFSKVCNFEYCKCKD